MLGALDAHFDRQRIAINFFCFGPALLLRKDGAEIVGIAEGRWVVVAHALPVIFVGFSK